MSNDVSDPGGPEGIVMDLLEMAEVTDVSSVAFGGSGQPPFFEPELVVPEAPTRPVKAEGHARWEMGRYMAFDELRMRLTFQSPDHHEVAVVLLRIWVHHWYRLEREYREVVARNGVGLSSDLDAFFAVVERRTKVRTQRQRTLSRGEAAQLVADGKNRPIKVHSIVPNRAIDRKATRLMLDHIAPGWAEKEDV